MEYPKKRNLDGVYFRVERDGKWENACFSDMTEDEQRHVLEGRSEEWLTNLAVMLAETIRHLGDQFGIIAHYEGSDLGD